MERRPDTYYYKVYQDLVAQIYVGKYKKGDILPSLKEFCDIYGVGRNTVRSALQLLQEHGYIKMEPRKQAVISFDCDDLQYQKSYLAEALGRKTAIFQVYDFMEFAMPAIFVYILKGLPRSLRTEIAELIVFFSENLSVKTEAKMQAGVMQLYRLIIALPNNQLLEKLFFAIFSYIQIPVINSEWEEIKLRAIAPLFKTTFKKFQKYIVAQEYDKLGQQVSIFCQTTKKRVDRYLSKFSTKIKAVEMDERARFTWTITGKPEYVQLASALVFKIGRGDYKNGDILPSYVQLAEENGVSEITSRNAIEVLGKLKIVTTINGVGTKVEGFSQTGRDVFLKDMEMRGLILSYIEALQLLIILCRPVLDHGEEMMTEKERDHLKSQFIDQGPACVLKTLLPYAGPVAVSVFECLKNELAWGYLLIIKKNQEKEERALKILTRPEVSIAELIYEDCQQYFDQARQIARKNSIDIPLSIL